MPAAGKAAGKAEANILSKSFVVLDKQGTKMIYEWWDAASVKKAGLLDVANRASADAGLQQDLDLPTFTRMLQEHNVDVKKFGVGTFKTLKAFAGEVTSGAVRLMLDAAKHKTLVRVVDIVLLKLTPEGKTGALLVEVQERYPDGRERVTNRLPGTKKEPHENMRQTVNRILRDMLNIDPSMVKCSYENVGRVEEETESPSYPAVRTVYRKEIVEGVIFSPDAKKMGAVGNGKDPFTSKDTLGNTKFLHWLSNKEAEARKVKVTIGKAEAISTLVRAPIGIQEAALTDILKSKGNDISKWGTAGNKTLKDFSLELTRGESTLIENKSGEMCRVVDVVVLIIQNNTSNETLVQAQQVDADGKTHNLKRLPGAKHRPDENQFLSARRVLRRQMEVDDNLVKIDQNASIIEEEKPTAGYPGLKTVYRKRIIKGVLAADGN